MEGVLGGAEDGALVEEVLDVVEDEALGVGVEDGFNNFAKDCNNLGTKEAFDVSESLRVYFISYTPTSSQQIKYTVYRHIHNIQ